MQDILPVLISIRNEAKSWPLLQPAYGELERVWDERYEKQHGFWRHLFRHVVEQFLDCGDLRCGFARLWCPACRKDLLLPYSLPAKVFLSLLPSEARPALCRA
jgi:hypothetical protein